MTTQWFYALQTYDSEADVNAAVTDMKSKLDNEPTAWCEVKLLGGNANDGWIVPPEKLTDTEINNLDANSFYNVSAVISGTTYTAISGSEAVTRINELRTEYAQNLGVNTITKVNPYEPTNQDMSGYV